MEEVEKGGSWNKKRIIIAIVVVLLLMVGGIFVKTKFFANSSQQKSVKGISVEISTQPEPRINIQEAVREKINSLKQQVSSLNVSDIASSSPQVQKILNDIKSLEQYPSNQVKEICRKICGL